MMGVILVEIKAKSAKLELELGLSVAIAQFLLQQLTTVCSLKGN